MLKVMMAAGWLVERQWLDLALAQFCGWYQSVPSTPTWSFLACLPFAVIVLNEL